MHPKQRMSALTALFLGVTAVLVAVITSASIIAIYAMNVGDRWGGDVIKLVNGAVTNLPETIKGLPPAIGDVLDDRRTPEYVEQLGVQVRLILDETGRTVHPVVSIENRGPKMVTLLALRIVAMDGAGNPVTAWNEYAATPIAIDHDWRGPIMPSSTRQLSLCRHHGVRGDVTAEWEITDIRVWSESAEDQ
ncbi:MAG: hypothetical protein JSV19_08090 [Phycisphaerales bacterium]|nr:MAG: hypothetical protein JSV19_08090 [Phycisphaerales bacterium]